MDKINTFITQFSQRNLEKKILFPYKQSCMIANDIFRKKKSRYETIVDNCEFSTKKNMQQIECLIKKKYVLGNYSLLKKEKVIPKIINLLYTDQLQGISYLLFQGKQDVSQLDFELNSDFNTSCVENSNSIHSIQKINHVESFYKSIDFKNIEPSTTYELEMKNETETEFTEQTDFTEKSERNDKCEINETETDFHKIKKMTTDPEVESVNECSGNKIFFESKIIYDSFEYLGIELIRMKDNFYKRKSNSESSIVNSFLFSILYSIDTLYCNWMMPFDTNANVDFFTEAQRNVVFFEKYLHGEILKKFYSSKIKQRKMLESLQNSKHFENICEIVAEVFFINLLILIKNEDESYNTYLFPSELVFNKKKKTIFIVDWSPTCVGTSNILPDSFWKDYFKKEITNKSKLADIRKFCKILQIQDNVDIKNKKNIIEQVIYPKIDLLMSI